MERVVPSYLSPSHENRQKKNGVPPSSGAKGLTERDGEYAPTVVFLGNSQPPPFIPIFSSDQSVLGFDGMLHCYR